jgi:hypothetical protein
MGGQVGIGTTSVDSTISVDIQNASPTSNNVFLRIKNIIFSDYENATESLKNIVKKDYPNATFSSFSGWSRGGLNAWAEVGNFDFVGLMDPSMPRSGSIPNTTDPRAFMMYNPNNWHISYPLIEANQRLYGPKMGNRATELKQGHSVIPVTFLKTYRNRL